MLRRRSCCCCHFPATLRDRDTSLLTNPLTILLQSFDDQEIRSSKMIQIERSPRTQKKQKLQITFYSPPNSSIISECAATSPTINGTHPLIFPFSVLMVLLSSFFLPFNNPTKLRNYGIFNIFYFWNKEQNVIFQPKIIIIMEIREWTIILEIGRS